MMITKYQGYDNAERELDVNDSKSNDVQIAHFNSISLVSICCLNLVVMLKCNLSRQMKNPTNVCIIY